MKLLFENWRGYLNEIGEGSAKPYSYVPPKIYDNYGEELLRDGDRVQYEFTTEARMSVVWEKLAKGNP